MVNVTLVQKDIYSGMIQIFGNTLLAVAFLFVLLAIMCVKTSIKLEGAVLIFLPSIVGLVEDNLLPVWVKALVLVGLGILWGITIIRITRSE